VTELGVSEIVLVKTQNSNADYEDSESFLSLHRVCVESAEQCERLSIPRLLESVSFQQLSAHWGSALYRSDTESDPRVLNGGEGESPRSQMTEESALSASRLLVCRERFKGGEPLLRVLLDTNSKLATDPRVKVTPENLLAMRGPVGIFVGPEGGFTAAELDTLAGLPETFQFVTLGDRCLYVVPDVCTQC
jgi:16S rRNA U1498 N3-methylase RsmE